MQVVAGQPFTSSLIAPAGPPTNVGARIEVPITRAIRVGFQTATLDASGSIYTVTLTAPVDAGDYNLVWMTGDDSGLPVGMPYFIPLQVLVAAAAGIGTTGPDGTPTDGMSSFVDVDPTAIRPSVDEVAMLERTRTVSEGGDPTTTFDSTTVPTDTDVNALIDQAVQAIMALMRSAYPASYYIQVKHLVCLYTAMLIEGSFFRESQTTEASADLWRNLLTTELQGVNSSIEIDLQHASLTYGWEPIPLPPMPISESTYR